MLRADSRSARLPLSWARQPAQDAAKAQRIAGQVCAACHAADGNSVAAANPKIAGQFAEYLQKQLARLQGAAGGKKPARESAIMTRHGGQPLRRRHEGPRRVLRGPEAASPPRAADKDLAALGQKIWRGGIAAQRRSGVRRLPRPRGRRHSRRSIPRLAGQFAEYVAAQLKAFKDGARANDANGVMRGVAARMTDARDSAR